jgi:hypothetical protein
MSPEKKDKHTNNRKQTTDTDNRFAGRLISAAMAAPDPQFSLPHDFAATIADKAMPKAASPEIHSGHKGFLIALISLSVAAFIVACWLLGIGEVLVASLGPYKYLLLLALIGIITIQILDVKLIKQKQALL